MSKESGGTSLLYFLAGAATGAALGVLFAPRAGKETRENIADWLDERRETSKEFIARVKESGSEKKEQISAALRAGKHAFQEARHNQAEVG